MRPLATATAQVHDLPVTVVRDAGLPMLIVENPLGRSVIALQGAHVMAFQPAGGREMLWISPKTLLQDGVPIRGGIPLCLPWFGPGPDGKSMHGFARTRDWSLTSFESHGDGATRLTLELGGDASTCASRTREAASTWTITARPTTIVAIAFAVPATSRPAARSRPAGTRTFA